MQKLLLVLITIFSLPLWANEQDQNIAGIYKADIKDCQLNLVIDEQGRYVLQLNGNYRDIGKIEPYKNKDGEYIKFSDVTAWRTKNGFAFQNYGPSHNYYLNFKECTKGPKHINLERDENPQNVDLDRFFNCANRNQDLTFPITQEQFACFYDGNPYVYDFNLKPEYRTQTKPFKAQELAKKLQANDYFSWDFSMNEFAEPRYFEAGKFEIDDEFGRDGYTYKIIMYRACCSNDYPEFNVQINSYNKDGNIIDTLLLGHFYLYEGADPFSKFTINRDLIYIDRYLIDTYFENEAGIGDPIPEDEQTAKIEKKHQFRIRDGKFYELYFYDAEKERREHAQSYQEDDLDDYVIENNEKQEEKSKIEDFLRDFYAKYLTTNIKNKQDLPFLRQKSLTPQFLCSIQAEIKTKNEELKNCQNSRRLDCTNTEPILCTIVPRIDYPYSDNLNNEQLFKTFAQNLTIDFESKTDEINVFNVCHQNLDSIFNKPYCLKVTVLNTEDGFLIDNVEKPNEN